MVLAVAGSVGYREDAVDVLKGKLTVGVGVTKSIKWNARST
jgi:hypothetical protein